MRGNHWRPPGLTGTLQKGFWIICLVTGIILLLGRSLWVLGTGLSLTAASYFVCRPEPRKTRSLLKFAAPILVFIGAYGAILSLGSPVGSLKVFSVDSLTGLLHLLLRSVGMLFALFALEQALQPLALRARAGTSRGGRALFMLGLSYQLVPVLLQSLEGVALVQRSFSRFWWLRPSCLLRAALSLFVLSHRLSEELALALLLRLPRTAPAKSLSQHPFSPFPAENRRGGEGYGAMTGR